MTDERNKEQKGSQQQSQNDRQDASFSNPQNGSSWDNYQTRTLSADTSSDTEREGGDDALSGNENQQSSGSDL